MHNVPFTSYQPSSKVSLHLSSVVMLVFLSTYIAAEEVSYILPSSMQEYLGF